MNSESDPLPPENSVDKKSPSDKKSGWLSKSFNPFRIATLRGLAVVLPPLLTILVFAWAWNTIDRVVLRPVESLAQNCVAWSIEDIRDQADVDNQIKNAVPPGSNLTIVDGVPNFLPVDGTPMVRVGNQWIPKKVYETVIKKPGERELSTAHEYYKRYVQIRYLKRQLIIPALLAAFLALMYLIGKLLAVGIGRIFWVWFEAFINQIPIIRNVYSSVKQVTDFAFSDNSIEFNRVVAIEYPRKGIWSIGFVTGEGFLDLRKAVGEPMLSVLMPTSPMPMTGFTVTVRKSETIELDITIDQAIQFCVSCGVVVPNHQLAKSAIEGEVRRRAGQNQISTQPKRSASESPSAADTTDRAEKRKEEE